MYQRLWWRWVALRLLVRQTHFILGTKCYLRRLCQSLLKRSTNYLQRLLALFLPQNITPWTILIRVTVATAPQFKAIGPLTGGIAAGGRLLVLTPNGTIEVKTLDLILRNISVVGYPSGHALDSEEAIAFTKLHDVHCMVEKFPFKDVQKAFDHMVDGKARFRSVLVM